jgi:hypothetical protein
MKPRYLTKSNFALALDCATKLFYTSKDKYANQTTDDSFLKSLAEGGFQVGELAKCYYPGGVQIDELDYATALNRTQELLLREKVIIYEAAFQYHNFFVRTDILVKTGNKIQIIEVKAKSFRGNDPQDFMGKKGINGAWLLYIYDVSFQKYVVSHACPEMQVKASLMLADKDAKASVDGLNQHFFLATGKDDRKRIHITGNVSLDALGDKILTQVSVDDIAEGIYNGTYKLDGQEGSFEERIEYLADHYAKDKKIITPVGTKCKRCEFRATIEEEQAGKISGFKECWKQAWKLQDKDFDIPWIFDIWKYLKKPALLDDGILFMKDVMQDRINPIPGDTNGMSTTERQWIQIEKVINNNHEEYFDEDGYRLEAKSWNYPLHFIDFETSAVAIPFHKGMSPYEGIAFQFSHHQVSKEGRIEHKGQYICDEPGKFPNFEFLRALKNELDKDNGTIFRYHNHENTYLSIIYKQLMVANIADVPDKQELMDWIQTVAHPSGSLADQWPKPPRDMVDLYDLVKRFYYHPATNGSISIKAVLPAVLNSSKYLQEKYSQPVYGKGLEVSSLNLENWVWVKNEDGKVKDPYKLLPPLLDGLYDEDVEYLLAEENAIAGGGAAMMAFAKMQFTQMTDKERLIIAEGLFRYCELDTFAMVMIWEHFHSRI